MSMIYIEEIVDDDDHHDDGNEVNMNDNVDVDVDVDVDVNANANANVDAKANVDAIQGFAFQPCPQPIGGGSSLTIVKDESHNSSSSNKNNHHVKAYVFGGCGRSGVPSASLHCFDFETNEWECNIRCQGTSSPCGARFGHAAFSHGMKLYIHAGQRYSSSSSSPTTKADEHGHGHGPKSGSGSESESGSSHSTTTLGCCASMYCLDTNTMTWEEIEMKGSEGRDVLRGSSSSSMLLLLPEKRHSHSLIPITRTSTCSDDDNDPSTCSEHTRTRTRARGVVVLFGGANEHNTLLNDLWSFDLTSNVWVQLLPPPPPATMPTCGSTSTMGACPCPWPCPREMHAASFDSETNCMYVIGGRRGDGTICQDLWAYYFDESKWVELASPPSARCAHITGLVQGRYLLVFGGYGEEGISNDCLTYDTHTNEWTTSAGAGAGTVVVCDKGDGGGVAPRFAHTACMLDEGGIITAGGVNQTCDLSELMVIRK